MRFVDNSFEACWTFLREKSRHDIEAGTWIMTRMGKEGNQIELVSDGYVRVKSRRPAGKGWREISRSQFLKVWSYLVEGKVLKGLSDQATLAILIHYFDDLEWSADGWIESVSSSDEVERPSEDTAEREREGTGIEACGAGPSPYERRTAMSEMRTAGLHRAIFHEINSLLSNVDGWMKHFLPDGSKLIPDLMVTARDKSIALVLEIKSDGSLASLYEAIGQIEIYSGLYTSQFVGKARAIVMPEASDAPEVLAVLEALGISVFTVLVDGDEFEIPGLHEWLVRLFASN